MALPSFLETVQVPRSRRFLTPADVAPINPELPPARPVQPTAGYDEPIANSVEIQPTPVPTPQPPLVGSDNRGRPKLLPLNPNEDRAEQARQYESAVQTYEPQEAHGYRRWLLPIAERFLRGSAAGGLVGGVGGAAVGALKGQFDPKEYDRAWKEREEQEAQKRSAFLTDQADSESMRRYREAQAANYNAEAEAAKNAPEKPPPTGYRVLTSEEYGLPAGTKIQQVFKGGTFTDTLQNGRPLVLDTADPAKAPGAPHESSRVVGEGEFDGIPAGTEIRTIWNGKSYEDQLRDNKPIIAKVAPSEKDEPPKADFKTRAAWFYKKQTEQEQEAARLEGEANKIDPMITLADGQKGVDPVLKSRKDDLLKQAQEAKTTARSYRDKGDEAATEAKPRPRTQSSIVKPAKDGKYHYTMSQIQERADSEGVSVDDILKIMQGNPKVIIDQ